MTRVAIRLLVTMLLRQAACRRFKEIALLGSQGYNWDFQDALTLLERGCLDLKPLITHRIGLEALQSGFETLLNPDARAVKAVVVMG